MDEGIIRVFHSREIDGLRTNIIGKKVYKYDTVNSTNDLAFRYALEQKEAEGSVFWARAQTKGRGRLGRRWVSLKDKGLYFSIILRPDILIKEAPRITLLCGLSICKAMRKIASSAFLIKWPNDIVVEDKKIGGILTEMGEIGSKTRVKFIIVGVGINTNFKPEELPIKEATSLSLLREEKAEQETVLSMCLKELDSYYLKFRNNGVVGIIEEARQFSSLWGKQIKINGLEEGAAVDFDNDGALIVRQDNGFLKHIYAGEVKCLRQE